MSLELLAVSLIASALMCFLIAALIGWILAVDDLTKAYHALAAASQEAAQLHQLAQLQNDFIGLVAARSALLVIARIARAIVNVESR